MEATLTNPLGRLAEAVSERAAIVASVGGRVLGAALLLVIAFDQSYDRTQVFAPLVAVIALGSCLPLGRRLAFWIAGLGAGLLFFAGTVLTHLGAGVGVLLCGLLAGFATLAWNYRKDATAWPTAISFLAAFAMLGVIMLAVFFTVKG